MEGPLLSGSPIANALGFTEDKFEGYIYCDDNVIWISTVISLNPRKGNLQNFVDDLLDAGYQVNIPTPLQQMVNFLKKNDFTLEHDETDFGVVDVWTKKRIFENAESDQ